MGRRRAPGASGVQLGEANARAAILEGAAKVFARVGVRSASVADILAEAGVSRRTYYRFYANKEEALVALYRVGTDELLAACRRAVAKEVDPLRQVEQCIEAHLRNASVRGRLMFVLGGEAQRRESLLHARRMQVHAELVALFVGAAGALGYGRSDALLYRTLVLALEGVTRIVLEEGDEGRKVSDANIDRARKVMTRLASAALAGDAEGVTRRPARKAAR